MTMASLKKLLHDTLDDLKKDDLKRFKSYLKDDGPVGAGKLEKAGVTEIVDIMMEHFGAEEAVKITLKILKKMNQNQLAKELKNKYTKEQDSSEPAKKRTRKQDEPSNKDEYKMESIPRGLCVIINNENFEKPEKKRNGSQKDVDTLKALFEDLGFQVEVKKDQPASEIKQLMIDYSKDPRHADCFVCCVMSHGDETGVLGYDRQICPLNDITSPFDGYNCPSLIGKPKVFFIQACRGREMQRKVLAADGPGASRMQESGNVSHISIAKDSDFLIAMSTVEGYKSIRDTYSGSWFIQSLCKHLKQGSTRGQDILGILTKVNNEVSQKEGTITINNVKIDAKMTPQPLFTLRKRLVFRAPKAAASK